MIGWNSVVVKYVNKIQQRYHSLMSTSSLAIIVVYVPLFHYSTIIMWYERNTLFGAENIYIYF